MCLPFFSRCFPKRKSQRQPTQPIIQLNDLSERGRPSNRRGTHPAPQPQWPSRTDSLRQQPTVTAVPPEDENEDIATPAPTPTPPATHGHARRHTDGGTGQAQRRSVSSMGHSRSAGMNQYKFPESTEEEAEEPQEKRPLRGDLLKLPSVRGRRVSDQQENVSGPPPLSVSRFSMSSSRGSEQVGQPGASQGAAPQTAAPPSSGEQEAKSTK